MTTACRILAPSKIKKLIPARQIFIMLTMLHRNGLDMIYVGAILVHFCQKTRAHDLAVEVVIEA